MDIESTAVGIGEKRMSAEGMTWPAVYASWGGMQGVVGRFDAAFPHLAMVCCQLRRCSVATLAQSLTLFLACSA